MKDDVGSKRCKRSVKAVFVLFFLFFSCRFCVANAAYSWAPLTTLIPVLVMVMPKFCFISISFCCICLNQTAKYARVLLITIWRKSEWKKIFVIMKHYFFAAKLFNRCRWPYLDLYYVSEVKLWMNRQCYIFLDTE